jgi:hypothetical protein
VFGKSIIVNKSNISMLNVAKIIAVFNNKLSLVIKHPEHVLLSKLHYKLFKSNKIGIITLEDLSPIAKLPEYPAIYKAVATLLKVLQLNGYDNLIISNLLFEENSFKIKKKPSPIMSKQLTLLKYKITKNILSNQSLAI